MKSVKYIYFLFCLFLLFFSKLSAIEINRVILATNNNPTYIEFWPVVAPLWQKMGFCPTLALIGDETCSVDTSLGDVIRFPPIPGVSEAMQAQCVRLLLPILFPDDGCIISDIDMLPISKSYFVEGAKYCPDDGFVVYRNGDYSSDNPKYPMCYFAAKGAVFTSVFGISTYEEISPLIQVWSTLGLGWHTDELVLYDKVNEWKSNGGKLILLGHRVEKRLDRWMWEEQIKSFDINDYIDCHCPRPYSEYKESIDKVVNAIQDLLVNNQLNAFKELRKTEFFVPVSPFSVYSQIKNLFHPTLEDYRFLQKHLTTDPGGIICPVGDGYVDQNLKSLKILGPVPSQYVSGTIAVNCDPGDKENCLLVYSTFNKNFAQNVERLVHYVAHSDFKGHIIYRVGGWPNIEGGDLVLAHVPYAFKVCAFREAQRLGYKRAFWLDSPAIPRISLNDVFQQIADIGYYVQGSGYIVGDYMSAQAAAYFNISLAETKDMKSCSAGIFGVDFTNPQTSQIIDILYQAAASGEGYSSPRSDQNALSIILHQLGFLDWVPDNKMLENFYWIR